MYNPQEFAEMIGVSVKTLQRGDNENKWGAHRSPSNRRYKTHKRYGDYGNVTAYFPKNGPGDWTVERHRIKIPTLGWVKLKESGYIPKETRNR